MATRLNLTMIRNDTWQHDFTLRDEENNPPVGLATSECTFTVRSVAHDSVAVSGTTTGGEIVQNGSTGVVSVTIPMADTDVDPGKYKYDLQVVPASGLIRTTAVDGALVVKEDQTRP